MSTIDLFLNFILGMLSRYKQGDPKTTLIVDILNKGFQMAKCVSTLLESGFETVVLCQRIHQAECEACYPETDGHHVSSHCVTVVAYFGKL